MRAVQVTRFGGPEVLEAVTVPDPVAGPGDLLLEVAAAEVLFLDTQLRAGWGQDYFPIRPPFVPGVGVAGTVTAVGDGVDDAWVGRRVIASTTVPHEYRGGGYAERAAVQVTTAHPIPDGVPFEQAVAALSDGVMGVTRIEQAQARAGDVAVITAAAGSIGTWLIPMLKAQGVTVVAAVRGEHKSAFALDHGADSTLDYGRDDWADGLPDAIDLAFDGTGGPIGATVFERVRSGGTFFSYGSAAGDFANVEGRGVRVVGLEEDLSPEAAHAAAGRALALIADGTIVPVLGQVVPLEQAAEAHRAMDERRVTGKTVLTP